MFLWLPICSSGLGLRGSAIAYLTSNNFFDDVLTFPPAQRAGPLMKAWKQALLQDESANSIIVTAGSKRKAVGLSIHVFAQATYGVILC